VNISDTNSGLDKASIGQSDFSLDAGSISSIDTSDVTDGATGTQTVVISLSSPVDADTVFVSLQADGIADKAGNSLATGSAAASDMDSVAPTHNNVSRDPSATDSDPEGGSSESDSNDGDDSSGTSGSSSRSGSSGSSSGSSTFLLGERVHTQTLEHSTLNEIAIDFAEPVDGLVRVAVVEATDRPTIESSAAIVGAVSITPPRESTETNATLAFTLNATALEAREIDPTDIVVYRIDTAETVHEPVTASVTAETNDTVTVAAETPGFSTFVLATTQSETGTESEAVQTESVTETEEPLGDPESTTEDNSATTEASNVATPGFGPLVALVALVMLALAAVGRNWDHP